MVFPRFFEENKGTLPPWLRFLMQCYGCIGSVLMAILPLYKSKEQNKEEPKKNQRKTKEKRTKNGKCGSQNFEYSAYYWCILFSVAVGVICFITFSDHETIKRYADWWTKYLNTLTLQYKV